MATKTKVKSNLFHVGFMTISQIAARAMGAVKDILVAYFFGASLLVDIYFLIITFPGYVSNLINGHITSLSLPELAKEKENPSWALVGLLKYFFRTSFLISAIFVIIATFYLGLFQSDNPNYLYMTATLVLLMATVPMDTINQVGVGWLSFGKDFKQLSLLCLIGPFVGLFSFFLMVSVFYEWSLPLSHLLARFSEALFYIFVIHPTSGSEQKWNHKKKPEFQPGFGRDYRQLGFASLFLGSTTIIDNWMASLCGPGSVSIYNFGTKVVAVSVSVLMTVATWFFHQEFNNQIVRKKFSLFKREYLKAISLIVFFGVLGSLVLSLLSPFFVDFLYNRGKLNPDQLLLIDQTQIHFSFQLAFSVAGVIASKCLSSMKLNKQILVIAIFSTMMNIVLNLTLIPYLGVAGIALSTSFMYLFSFLAMNILLLRKVW